MLKRLFAVPGTDVDQQRRGRTVITISLILLAVILLALPLLFANDDAVPSMLALLIGAILVGTAIFSARRGWVDLAAIELVALVFCAVLPPILLRPQVTSTAAYLLLPLVIAGVVLRPWQVWLVLAGGGAVLWAEWLTLTIQIDPMGARSILINVLILLGTVGTISFLSARFSTQAFAAARQARGQAEAAARRLELLNLNLEAEVAARTSELRTALADVEARAQEQQRLLDEVASQRAVIHELSVPVLPVRRGTLVMPLVGALDSARLRDLQAQALSAIEQNQARTILLDITGVPVIDTQVAQGLLQTISAARLLGAEPVLIGVRPEVAQTMVALGIDLRHVRTAADLASAIDAR